MLSGQSIHPQQGVGVFWYVCVFCPFTLSGNSFQEYTLLEKDPHS